MVLHNFLILVTEVSDNYQYPKAVSYNYLYWHFLPKRALSHYCPDTKIQELLLTDQ